MWAFWTVPGICGAFASPTFRAATAAVLKIQPVVNSQTCQNQLAAGRSRMNATRTTDTVPDAAPGNWVDRLAPAAVKPYLRLARFDRPIGAWLLLFPAWWSQALG